MKENSGEKLFSSLPSSSPKKSTPNLKQISKQG